MAGLIIKNTMGISIFIDSHVLFHKETLATKYALDVREVA